MKNAEPSAPRNDPAWHEWRRQGVGGSDVAALCGMSPWSSPFALYMEKRGEVPEADLSGDPNVEFGSRLEPIVPAWFHDETGLWLVGEQTWCTHPEVDFHRCTIDAFVAEAPVSEIEDALGVCEIKVTGDHAGDWEEQIPNQYAIQGQWQLHVTGRDHLWFAVVHVHQRVLRIYEMDRDDTVIAELVRLVGDFWERVKAGTPPPVDGHRATSRVLREVYPQHVDDEVEIGSDLHERWRIAKARVATAQAELDVVENELKAALGDAAYATVGGQRVASWRTQTARRLDTKAIKAEAPEVYERWGVDSTSRVLRPMSAKEKK